MTKHSRQRYPQSRTVEGYNKWVKVGGSAFILSEMHEFPPYQLLANTVLLLHAIIVLFVVGGLVLVVVGNLRSWQWVNSLWFRLAHLVTISIVAGEAWFGLMCPLTTLEMGLRAKASSTIYTGGFMEHWLQTLLFWQAPPWVFTTAYTAFGLAVAAAWWYFPPRTGRHRRELDA